MGDSVVRGIDRVDPYSTFQHGCYTAGVVEKDVADLIALLEQNGLEVYVDAGTATGSIVVMATQDWAVRAGA